MPGPESQGNAPACAQSAFTAASQSNGEGAGTATVTAQLSAASGKTVTVPFTVSGNATAGTDYTYITEKNRRNDPDRLVLRKYDPRVRRHVEFREER